MDSSDRLPKHLLIGFGLALTLYAVFFVADQWTRTRKGPWQVLFTTNELGDAAVVVTQPGLKIEKVVITFAGERLTDHNPSVVRFERPQQTIPFGKTKFEDLTYLPGSVAVDFFGHEVELLPRTLYLNKQEHSWSAGTNHILKPEEKLPPEASYDPRKKKRSLFRR